MSQLSFRRSAAALGVGCIALAAQVRADWTINTYLSALGSPQITTTAIADKYLSGELPARFTDMGTISEVDLFENGGTGQTTFDHPFPGLDFNEADGSTSDYATQVTGTLVVASTIRVDFWTDTDDGNRLRIDLNRNGTYEDFTPTGALNESVVRDGGLQGVGTPEPSRITELMPGNYKFEFTTWERGGGAGAEAGYRLRTAAVPLGPYRAFGDTTDGISLMGGSAKIRTVGADLTAIPGGPDVTTLADADVLRIDPALVEPGFPVMAVADTFNILDTGGDGNFAGGMAPPGLRSAGIVDGDDFAVYGTGMLVVPTPRSNVIFRGNSDDGQRLLIDLNKDGDLLDPEDMVLVDDAQHGAMNVDAAPINLPAGEYLIEYMFFERAGGAAGELSVSFDNGTTFRLVGDNAAVAAGLSFDVIGSPPPVIAGDFNNNGVVDAVDYVLWRNGDTLQNEGGVTPGANTAEDYATWRMNFARTPGAGAVAAVPEAATIVSCWLVAVFGLVYGRRRRSD